MTTNDLPDVIVFGEALVDFLPESIGPIRGVERFRKVCGGAPANVAVGLARLGSRPRLLTRLGEDEFGYFLRDALGSEGIDVDHVRFTTQARTGITFVCIGEDGERSFMPYRNQSADLTVHADDFRDTPLCAPIVHLGSNLMPYASGRLATLEMLERARAEGRLVSFDANIRVHLWPNEQAAHAAIDAALRQVDLVKLSDEELVFLGGNPDDPLPFYARVRELGVRWLVVTYGPRGARLLGPDGLDLQRPTRKATVIDTTGAGDGFLAGFLHGLLREVAAVGSDLEPPRDRPAALDREAWLRVIDLANYVGTSACTVLGATGGLPRASEVPWESFGRVVVERAHGRSGALSADAEAALR